MRRTVQAWRCREVTREPLRVVEVPGMYAHPRGRFFSLQPVESPGAPIVMRGHGERAGPWHWSELSRHEWWCFDPGIKLALRKEFTLPRDWKPAR